MPIDLCNPCCTPDKFYKPEQTYWQARLTIMCQIFEALGGTIEPGQNQCTPCCNPSESSRNVDSFRQSSLITWCKILEQVLPQE